MKQRWTVAAVASGTILLAILLYIFSPSNKTPPLGAGSQGTVNVVDKIIRGTTTTLDTNSQIVIPASSTRIYALIINDSDTDIYLHFQNFTDHVAASTTVIRNRGIRLNANGGSYEILPENMYVGDVWVASTTASGKRILTSER